MVGWRFTDAKLTWRIVKPGDPLEPGWARVEGRVYLYVLKC